MSTVRPESLLGFAADDAGTQERSLVERARAGDPSAFRTIFDRHAPAVRRFLRDLLRDAEAGRARRSAAPAEMIEDAQDDRPTPEGALIGNEANRLLQGALLCLGEERRAALLLRIDHGLDYEEIRTIMGWPLAKVKNEIHRARLGARRAVVPLALSTTLGAATVLALLMWGGRGPLTLSTMRPQAAPPAPSGTNRGAAEIDEAEREWGQAAQVLERRWQDERQRLDARTAARLDRVVEDARAGRYRFAGDDLESRRVQLDGYSDYVTALQRTIADLEVSR